MEISVEQSVVSPQLPPTNGHLRVGDSILATIVYADLFDYPLTLDEITRYQVGTSYTSVRIADALAGDPALRQRLAHINGYYSLSERSNLATVRRGREQRSRRLWRKAILYSRWVSNMPFVRMVAVTGALSMHNVGSVPDIDLLVVAREGRVWTCRRALIGCVRLARLMGDDLCPNYILSESSLRLDQRDLYTAHELAQMVPMSGLPVFRRMLRANEWAASYLPGAFGPLGFDTPPEPARPMQRPIEALLRRSAFDPWETWELRRMRAKLRPALGSAAEVVCSPAQCKGHTGLHRQTVLERYERRLAEVKTP